jgi:hypothetical protein
MSRYYFEEVQRFRDQSWLLVLVLTISLGAIIPLIYGMYWQILQDVPWGDQPMSDTGMVVLFLFVILCMGVMAFMLLSMKLEVRLDEQGIHYRFIPLKNEWQLIRKDQISEYRFEKGMRLFTTGGVGYHRNVFTKTRSYRIFGSSCLSLKLNSGDKLLLGTRKPGEMEWALKKLITINQPG